MGRSPCCDKLGLKKGPWTPEEDQKLLAFIEENGHGNWRALPSKAGLQRCGKSCRLRWTNYLRPDIKRGKFSLQEEQTIIQLHALLGNRWSAIATHLPKRTDNEIKNYWNTHLKKRLTKMGIDPVTHKPKNDALLSAADGGQQCKNAANLSHMAQWESARLEAEARLVRQSKLRSSCSNKNNSLASSSAASPDVHVNNDHQHHQTVPSVSLTSLSSSSSTSAHHLSMTSGGVSDNVDRFLDTLKSWHGGDGWPSSSSANNDGFIGINIVGTTGINGSGVGVDIESPTSTLSFSENNAPPVVPAMGMGMGTTEVIQFMSHHHHGSHHHDNNDHHQDMVIKREGDQHFENEWSSLSFISSSTGIQDHDDDDDDNDDDEDGNQDHCETFMEGFTELLLSTTNNTATKNVICNERSHQQEEKSSGSRGINTTATSDATNSSKQSDYYEDNKTYWNSILNLVNSSSHSPMF